LLLEILVHALPSNTKDTGGEYEERAQTLPVAFRKKKVFRFFIRQRMRLIQVEADCKCYNFTALGSYKAKQQDIDRVWAANWFLHQV